MYGLALGRAGAEQPNSIQNAALGILRRYGTDAHVYLPGANGVAVSGLPTNNYTLSDGSTGYSAVDGTAGLVLDAAGAVGAELVTTSSQNGVAIDGVTSVQPYSIGSTNVVSTKLYQVYAVVSGYSGTGDVGFSSGTFASVAGVTRLSANGVLSGFVAGAGSTPQVFTRPSTNTANFSQISIREVTGIHATQATTANKPAVRRGLYNLLAQSNNFTGWGNAGAPTVTASTVTRTITGPTYVQGPSVTKSATAMPYSAIGKFTAGTGRYAAMRAQSTYPNFADAVFDLQNGTVYSSAVSGAFAGQVASIVKSANGECTCCVSFTTNAETAVNALASPNSNGVVLDGTDSSATSSFSSGGMAVAQGVWTAQSVLNEGGIPLTTSAAASNQSAGRYSWQFDGSNDSLDLAGANTGAQGAMIGAFRPNNAHFGSVFSSGGDTIGNPGCGIGVDSGSRASFLFGDGTTTNKRINSGATTIVGAAHVISAVWGTASQKLRVDGNQVGSGVEPVVPVSSDGISIGRIYASGDFFSGAVGPLISISGTVTDADLLTLERWVASQTPNGPTF